jgi:hypothetical protein
MPDGALGPAAHANISPLAAPTAIVTRGHLIVVVTSGCRRYGGLAQHGLPAKVGDG